MAEDHILVSTRRLHQDTCLCLTLNRPDKANALSHEMMHALVDCISGNHDKIIAFTGTGRFFCAGMDFQNLDADISIGGTIAPTLGILRRLFDAVDQHARTLALVNGAAAGGGIGLALLCSVVLASPDAYLRIPGGRVRMFTPIVTPILQSRLQGGSVPEMEGRDVSATEAAAVGLVDGVTDSPLALHADDSLIRAASLIESRPANRLAASRPDLVRQIDDAFAAAGNRQAADHYVHNGIP
ncbi:MAG: enoyl-CoA hydratase/isomerase family protein [Planctomycetota bacterium]